MAYGMRPTTHGGYQYNTGGFEEFKIADNYATSIFNGDLVTLVNAGTIERYTTALGPTPGVYTSTAAVPVAPALGVFVGCRYTDSNSTPAWAQMWTASGGTNAAGFVVTDPSTVFRAQYSAATWNDNLVGELCDVTIAAGNSDTGNSGNSIPATATNGGLRIVGVIRDGKNETASVLTPDILVRWSSPTSTLYGYQTAV